MAAQGDAALHGVAAFGGAEPGHAADLSGDAQRTSGVGPEPGVLSSKIRGDGLAFHLLKGDGV